MSKYKNNSKPKLDGNGEIASEAQAVRFTIKKTSYVVEPGKEVEIPEEHVEFLKSRGIALDLVKGSESTGEGVDMPPADHITASARAGKPAPAPAFAGDVKQSLETKSAQSLDVKSSK